MVFGLVYRGRGVGGGGAGPWGGEHEWGVFSHTSLRRNATWDDGPLGAPHAVDLLTVPDRGA